MPFVSALDLLAREKAEPRLTLGCPLLDAAVGGGLRPRGFTEVVGEAGAGKSQLVLRLCLLAQLPAERGGLGGGAYYLSTEGVVPIRRLQSLAAALQPALFPETASPDELLSRVTVDSVHEVADLWDRLQTRVPALLRSGDVRLVVVDSIAGLVRSEYAGNSAAALGERTLRLMDAACAMKRLAEEHGVVFVVTNQVTSRPDAPEPEPSLGVTWGACPSTRLMLVRGASSSSSSAVSASAEDASPASLSASLSLEREASEMRVAFSPWLPNAAVRYKVTGEGLVGV